MQSAQNPVKTISDAIIFNEFSSHCYRMTITKSPVVEMY